MRRPLGTIVLVLSASGYPLTQAAIRRWGVQGQVLVETVCAGLVIRDAAMIAAGAPRRLRRVPALLLWLELGAGAVATVSGLQTLSGASSADRSSVRQRTCESVRRAAVAILFSLHTIRFEIYLRPDRGRRAPAA
jgi:hypothetical protein